MDKKGFTLIELLAVIVILAVILAIAIPAISSIIDNSRLNTFKNQEKLLRKSAMVYLANNSSLYPTTQGSSTFIKLYDLINSNYITNILDPKDNSTCNTNSGVKVTYLEQNLYSYEPYLNCTNYKDDTEHPDANLSISGNLLTVEAYDLNNLTFNGTNSYIQLPMINNVRSIEFKFNMNAGGAPRYILDARTGSSAGYIYTGGFGTGWTNMYVEGVTTVVSYANVPTNKLSRVYFEASASFNDDINIFSRYTNNEFNWGKIFELRVWNKVLSNAEVLANKDRVLTAGTSGLLAYYKFDNGSGTVLTDYSGNNYNATVINPVWNLNSGIKEVRVKQNGTLISSSNQSLYTFNLSSGTYSVEIEDYIGNVTTKTVTT